MACAHWAKFTAAVDQAIGQPTREALPYPPILKELEGLPHRKKILPADKAAVVAYMREFTGGKGPSESKGCPYNFTDYRQPAFWVVAAAVVGIGAMIYTRKSK